MKTLIIFIVMGLAFVFVCLFKYFSDIKKQFLLDDLYYQWKDARRKREEFEYMVCSHWVSNSFDEEKYFELLQIELGAYELYRMNFPGDHYLSKIIRNGYNPWDLYRKLP